MHKFTKIIIAIIAVLGLSLSLAPIAPTYADIDSICSSSVPDDIKAAAGCPGQGSTDDLSSALQNVLNGVIASLGIVAVIFIVIGGVSYMTSTGDAGKLERAKKTIIYAAVGLIICALAAAIVNFTIGLINANSSTAGSSGNSGSQQQQSEKKVSTSKETAAKKAEKQAKKEANAVKEQEIANAKDRLEALNSQLADRQNQLNNTTNKNQKKNLENQIQDLKKQINDQKNFIDKLNIQ